LIETKAMTQTLEFKQNSHLHAQLLEPAWRTLNAGKLTGRWLNTDPVTQGLAQIVIKQDGDQFQVSAVGVGADAGIAWPKTTAEALANLEEEAGQRAVALAVTFDFGFMRAEAHIRVNKGVLVIVVYHTFLDDSGRSNYVNREFFYRQH
jgi:hypothetical protein